jgi:hypothetical protein
MPGSIMDSDFFALVADALERRTDLDRLEARGTLRIAFKKAGVDSSDFTFEELAAVFVNLMPQELEDRGIDGPDAVCRAVMESLPTDLGEATEPSAGSRDEIMRRLGGA